jgi:hypothetical protein
MNPPPKVTRRDDSSSKGHKEISRESTQRGEVDRWKLTKNSVPKIALIPCYHRFSQTELFGFIFPTIVDNRFVDNRSVNDSRKNETKKFGLGKPVVMWD